MVSEVVYTERTPRVVAARKLHRRAERLETGRFLVEGAQAVREAVSAGPVEVFELFATEAAASRHPDLLAAAVGRGARVSSISERAAAALSDTTTPQGILAVCATVTVPLADVLAPAPRLVAVLVGVADPGNAGTVIRAADAAGAGAVVLTGDSVDPHNGKCVRASAGSLFHLPIAVERDQAATLGALRAAGLRLLATDAGADIDLETATGLERPTAWLFGSEAHGLPPSVLAEADDVVAVPIYGRAESLNLATAAAVCLYRSASAQRGH
ncbi:MAG TPA: RNA methyltransferase [Pseudonocardiaceae bacterium]|nr:RNA methyltransferase [Pseudonocardiaceae bacterium]